MFMDTSSSVLEAYKARTTERPLQLIFTSEGGNIGAPYFCWICVHCVQYCAGISGGKRSSSEKYGKFTTLRKGG